MGGIYLGIDVGGTHTDGVAVEDCRVLHKVKVPTADDLRACTLATLSELRNELRAKEIRRVVLSTTLVTNAIVLGDLERVGSLFVPGPGMSPDHLCFEGNCRLLQGAVDHRGREVAGLDEGEVRQHLTEFRAQDIRVLAVAGKFSVRNPGHELRIEELGGDAFDYVASSHRLSGSLNFPRRAATAYLSAGVWRKHTSFVRSMEDALRSMDIGAPLYLLRADGGTQAALTFNNPAETALSGPAASLMGAQALDATGEETLTLDVGGTTTDISLHMGGAPLLEPLGATIGPYRTQVRSLYSRSTAAGGDSWVRVVDGELRVGPERKGMPAAFGGEHPTPTDALVFLGRTFGSRSRAETALRPVAEALGCTPDQAARRILTSLAREIARAVHAYVAEVNARPVYTVAEVLHGHKVAPRRAVAVGGPAHALAPYIEEALDLPVRVPAHFDVANAIGAALARVNFEVNLLADTALGNVTIPEAAVYRKVPSSYSFDEARQEAETALMELAREKGLQDTGAVAEVAEQESFPIVEGFRRVGSVHRIRMQIRPGILCQMIT